MTINASTRSPSSMNRSGVIRISSQVPNQRSKKRTLAALEGAAIRDAGLIEPGVGMQQRLTSSQSGTAAMMSRTAPRSPATSHVQYLPLVSRVQRALSPTTSERPGPSYLACVPPPGSAARADAGRGPRSSRPLDPLEAARSTPLHRVLSDLACRREQRVCCLGRLACIAGAPSPHVSLETLTKRPPLPEAVPEEE